MNKCVFLALLLVAALQLSTSVPIRLVYVLVYGDSAARL